MKNLCVCCAAKFNRHEWCYAYFGPRPCECDCIYNPYSPNYKNPSKVMAE